MSYFKPSDNNGPNYVQPQNQQQQQQGPVYQQPQVYQQNQGSYPPQQGGYPPQQGGYPPQQGGYPPQYGGYPPQYGGNPQYQVYPPNQQAQAAPQQTNINFNFKPAVIVANDNICIFCQNPYIIVSQRSIGIQTLIAFLILLFIFWPLCWLPFVIDDCKDKHYFCSQCGKLIYKKTFTMCT